MKRVEFTEEVKLGAATYLEGDVKAFEDDEADELVRLGWAKDEDGNTGERKPGAQKLEVQTLSLKVG